MANDSFIGEGLVDSPFFKAMREIDILTTRIRELEAAYEAKGRETAYVAAERDAQHAEIKRLRALLREAQLWVREYDGVNEYDCGELDADCLYCRIVAALGEREL